MTRPINFKSVDNKKTCKNSCSALSSVSCLAAYCEQSTLQLISQSSLNSQCRTCSQDLNEENLTEYGFRTCAAAYCSEEIEKENLAEDGRSVLALGFGLVGALTTVVLIGVKIRGRVAMQEDGADYRLI